MDKDVFDYSKALEVVDGDTELFEEIANLFLEDFPVNITRIREGVANRDAGALERASHRLKGSVANFSAKRAFDAAYKLEVIGREERLEEADAAKWRAVASRFAFVHFGETYRDIENKIIIVGMEEDKMHKAEEAKNIFECLKNASYIDMGTNKLTHSAPMVEKVRELISKERKN